VYFSCAYFSCLILVLVFDYQLSSNSDHKVHIPIMGSKYSHSTFTIYSKNVDNLVVLDEVAPP
jgi:hypothetical protein